MASNDFKVIFPDEDDGVDQNQECFTLVRNGQEEELRIHDYDKVYEVPGLYEYVVYDHLQCKSPETVCSLLTTEIEQSGDHLQPLRVLDFGAGNGIVGECLTGKVDCDLLVGVDIIPEAGEATRRDRPDVYDDYYILDLSRNGSPEHDELKDHNFNTLLTVAALGFDDIPTAAFLNAFNMLDERGWVAFNIKDRFLSEADNSGYKQVLDVMMSENLDTRQLKRYRHRYSLHGEPLHYIAVVGRKKRDCELELP